MADNGTGANLDIQVNVKTISDGQFLESVNSISSSVKSIASDVAKAQSGIASLGSTFVDVGNKSVTSMQRVEASINNLIQTLTSGTMFLGQVSARGSAIIADQVSHLTSVAGTANEGIQRTAQAVSNGLQTTAAQNTRGVNQQTAAVQNLQQAMGQMGRTGQNSFSGLSQQIFGSLYGLQFIVAQIHKITNAIEQMDLLRASYARIMGANIGAGVDQATTDMMQDATRIAYKYGATLKDVAGTMVEFARQGRSTDEIVHLTEHIGELRLMLATSTGKFLSMGEAMKSATTLMTQMDISVYQATDALKLMAEYDIRAATSFNQISDAMNKFGAAGKLAGMSVPEIIKAATAFTEIGVGSSRAGTALNAVLSRLSGTKQTIEAINAVGYSLTVVEGGATRATSAFEQLVEAYKKVVASGSSTQLNKFLTDVAGARQRSVVAAGLNRYIKQTSSAVTAEQFKDLTDTLQRAMSQALTLPTMSVKLSTVAFSGAFDAAQIKSTLKTQIDKLIQDLQTEFQQTGKVSRPDMNKLVSNWFGGLSSSESSQLIEANTELFKGLQSAIDDFMSHTESSFDRFQRYAEGATQEAKRIQEEALQAMQDTITIQKNRLATLFESTFLQTGFTDPVRAGLDQVIDAVERLAHVITTILGSALATIGFGDIARGARVAIMALEVWLYTKIPSILTGVLQGLVGVGRQLLGAISSTGGQMLKFLQHPIQTVSAHIDMLRGVEKAAAATTKELAVASGTAAAGVKATGAAAGASIKPVTGLALAMNLLNSALAWIGLIWSVGSMLVGWYQAWNKEQTELNNGLAAMRDRLEEDQQATERFSRALDNMKESSDALGESLGRTGDYLSKFVMNNDVRSSLTDAIAKTTNRPDLKAMPIAQRREAISRELLQNFPDEYIRYRNEYAQRQREAISSGKDFTEKQLDPVEYLGRMFSITGEYINGEFTGQLAQIGTIWTTMSATVAQEMTAMLNQIDEATKTFVTNLKNYQEQATTQQHRLTGDKFQGEDITPDLFTLNSDLQKRYLKDQIERAFAHQIDPNLATTPQLDVTANYYARHNQDLGDALFRQYGSRGIQGYLQTLREVLLPAQIEEIEKKASEFAKVLGIELDHTKIQTADEFARYMTAIQQFLLLNSSTLGDLLKSWDSATNKLESHSEKSQVRMKLPTQQPPVELKPGATWESLTPEQQRQIENSFSENERKMVRGYLSASYMGQGLYYPELLRWYRERFESQTPSIAPVPKLDGSGQTPLDPQMSTHTAQQVQAQVQAQDQLKDATKSTTQVLNQETDAQTRLKALTDAASERVKSLNETYEDLVNKRGTWQEARAEGDANWKKYAEEEIALKREQLKALEEEKRLLKENEKLRIDAAMASNIVDPKEAEKWKNIYGEAFSPQPLLDAQKEGISQLTKFQDMLADKTLGLVMSPEDLQKLQETQTKLDRYDEAVAEAFAAHARAYTKAKENLEKVKNNSQSTKAQIQAAEKAEAEARRQADEVLNQTLSSLHTSLQGTFNTIDQIRLLLAEQLIQLANEGKIAQERLKEALAGLGFTDEQIQYTTETKTVHVAKEDADHNVIVITDPETKKPKLREKDEKGNYKVPIYFMGADGKPDLSKPYTGQYEIETTSAEIVVQNAKIQGVSLPEGTDMYGESGAVAKFLQREVPKYANLILKYSKEAGVDPLVMAAMMKQESGYNTKAVNRETVVNGKSDPAAGLLQFISGTARSYGISGARRLNPSAIDFSDPRFDPEQTIQAGAKFMAAIKKKWGGDPYNTAWAWYAGLGHGKSMNPATAQHVRNVTAIYKSFVRSMGGRVGTEIPESAPQVNVTPNAGDALVAKEKELADLEAKLKSTSDKNEAKRLQSEIDKKRRELEKLKKGVAKAEEQDAKAAERAQVERERTLLQTVQQEHQERLKQIAETYKVIKDSEGNIIGYMNRAGSKENQEEVIAEQKKYIAELYKVLNQTTSSELARTKIRRQIQAEIAKLREEEFKLWDYSNKIVQNERQYALGDLDRPHKFAIEMSDLDKLNSLLKEEYDLQLKLMQAEWVRTQKDEVSIQVARRKFSTTMLKNYESALKDIIAVVKQLDKVMELRQQWIGGNAAADFLRGMHIKYPNLYKTYPHEQVNWQTTQALELRDIQLQRINEKYKSTSETWQAELAKLQQLMYDKMNVASGDLKFNPAQAKEIEDSWKKRVATLLEEGKITQEMHDTFVNGLSKGSLFAISANVIDPKTVETNVKNITEKIQGILSVAGVASDAQNQIQGKWQEIIQLVQGQSTKPAELTSEYLTPALDSYKQSMQNMLDSGMLVQEEFTAILEEFQKRVSIPPKSIASADLATALSAYKKVIDSQTEAGSIPKELSEKLWAEAERLLSALTKDSEKVDPVALKSALVEYQGLLESQRMADGFAQEAYAQCRAELQNTIEALIKPTEAKLSLSLLRAGIEQYKQFLQAKKESGKISVEAFDKLQAFVDGELSDLLKKTVPISNQNIKDKVESFKVFLTQQMKDKIISPEDLNAIVTLFGDSIDGLLTTPEMTTVDIAKSIQAYTEEMQKKLDAGKLSKEVFEYLVAMYREGITSLLQGGGVDVNGLQAEKVAATEDIQRRLAAGELTQEQADVQLAELESNFNTLLSDSPLGLLDIEKQLKVMKQITQQNAIQVAEDRLKDYFVAQGKIMADMLGSIDYSKLSRNDRFINPLNPNQVLRYNERALQALFSQVTTAYAEYGRAFEEGNWRGMLEGLSQLGMQIDAQVITDIEALDLTDSEKCQKILELSGESAKQVAEELAKNQVEGLAKLRTEFEQTISNALDQGWESSWDIGMEYGFSSEGWDALVTSWKKMAATAVKNAIWSELKPQLQGFFTKMFSTVFNEVTDTAKEVVADAVKEQAEQAAEQAGENMAGAVTKQGLSSNWFGSMFGGLFAGIFSSLIGFAIGALFADFTSGIQEEAQRQLDAQKDQIRSDGFGWSYQDSSSNVATPTYEFASPTTTESVKIIKVATTINISTDAAMAMASHRRELERVVSELVQAYERQVTKTVGTQL